MKNFDSMPKWRFGSFVLIMLRSECEMALHTPYLDVCWSNRPSSYEESEKSAAKTTHVPTQRGVLL